MRNRMRNRMKDHIVDLIALCLLLSFAAMLYSIAVPPPVPANVDADSIRHEAQRRALADLK